MRMVSMGSAGQNASIDMHIELLRLPFDSVTCGHLRSEVDVNVSELTNTCFDASRLEMHDVRDDGVQNIILAFFVQKLFTKTITCFKTIWLLKVVHLTSDVKN